MEVGSWEWRNKSLQDLILLKIWRISTTTPNFQLPTPNSTKSLSVDMTEQQLTKKHPGVPRLMVDVDPEKRRQNRLPESRVISSASS